MTVTRKPDDGGASAQMMSTTAACEAPDALQSLLRARPARLKAAPAATQSAVQIGELVALVDDASTPLVRYASQPGSAALRARSVVDLHGAHIGRRVVLAFENADPARPLVMGVLTDGAPAWPYRPVRDQVEVDADGRRVIVTAQHELVLRCGQASITLTRSGRIVIAGEEVSTRAIGLNRVLGGSVQIN